MAISWITAFKIIPWGDVIEAAPAIARGARQLWGAVRKTEKRAPVPFDPTATPAERLQLLEQRVAELTGELAQSSELIAALAQQNTRLVGAVDTLTARTRLLLRSTVLLGAAVAGMLAYLIWGG